MKVARYEPSLQPAWDEFVRRSRNGTFLFERGYMDYHADRFTDHSLMIRNDRAELIALLPANAAGTRISTHDGLTYGGFVVGDRMGSGAMLEAFAAVREYLARLGFEALRYKTIPYIYHMHPAEEDRYALFRHGARLYRRDVLTVLRPRSRPAYQERRARKMRQASRGGITVRHDQGFGPFWRVLEENLRRAHGASPVHSLAEIELLAARFPRNIRLHTAHDGADVAGGAVVYDTGRVAHVQYIASSEQGREKGALDLLFSTLIEERYADREYFDFGISNEKDGTVLNTGLVEQKEGFGGRAVAHDFYEVTLP